ncbi:Mediator of RNA polymerase II transcription subunit 18-like protein [Drosera capensis]
MKLILNSIGLDDWKKNSGELGCCSIVFLLRNAILFRRSFRVFDYGMASRVEGTFHECVVQGIIQTEHVEALEILLQGLCGVNKERLRIHELCLKSSPNLGNGTSEFRLICDLEQLPEPTWTLRHIGGAMRGAGAEQLAVLVRSVGESKVSKQALRLFNALGYRLDHELLRVGFSFNFQRGAQITVTVSSVNKMLKLHAVDEAVPVTPGLQLVEVTAPASADNYTEVAAAVCSFCEYLAPLLHLSKPGVSTGVVPTAASAAASFMSDGGGTTL